MKRERRTTERLALPPRRSLLGGALIAIAALGVFAAHRSASSVPEERYVVAAHHIAAGTVISRADLGSIALDVPAGMSAVKAEQASKLVGRVAAGDIADLELLSESDVFRSDRFTDPNSVELSLDLPAARAMQGVIAAGDIVTVLSTDPQGAGTESLTHAALVSSVTSPPRESIGAGGSVRVVLSVQGPELAAEIVDAAVRSEMSLVLPANTPVEKP